jgi:hypothetical protein
MTIPWCLCTRHLEARGDCLLDGKMFCDGTEIDTIGLSSAKLNSVVVGLARGPEWAERECKTGRW